MIPYHNLTTRGAQNFWDIIPQTRNGILAQDVKVFQVSRPSNVLPNLEGPKDAHCLPPMMASGWRLRGSDDVVKHPWIDLKLAFILSCLGPISSLEFGE